MSTTAILLLGVLVSGLTLFAVILIGLGEAGDSAHSRPQDLSTIEKALVTRDDIDSSTPT